jgi:hypothetical protein
MKPTTIMNVEVSALCNLKCVYCMAPKQAQFRQVGLMSMPTFEKVIEWIKVFVSRGTQTEVNLFGNGEPTMNPKLPEFVRMTRDALPLCLPVHTNTNGGLMTEQLCDQLINAGITQIDITGHDHFFTARTMRLFQAKGIRFNVSYDFALVANDWAGQLKWFPSQVRYKCPWLSKGQLFIAWNGDILQCCFDAKATNVLGNIFTTNIDDIEIKSFELCKGCHQDV